MRISGTNSPQMMWGDYVPKIQMGLFIVRSLSFTGWPALNLYIVFHSWKSWLLLNTFRDFFFPQKEEYKYSYSPLFGIQMTKQFTLAAFLHLMYLCYRLCYQCMEINLPRYPSGCTAFCRLDVPKLFSLLPGYWACFYSRWKLLHGKS